MQVHLNASISLSGTTHSFLKIFSLSTLTKGLPEKVQDFLFQILKFSRHHHFQLSHQEIQKRKSIKYKNASSKSHSITGSPKSLQQCNEFDKCSILLHLTHPSKRVRKKVLQGTLHTDKLKNTIENHVYLLDKSLTQMPSC